MKIISIYSNRITGSRRSIGCTTFELYYPFNSFYLPISGIFKNIGVLSDFTTPVRIFFINVVFL